VRPPLEPPGLKTVLSRPAVDPEGGGSVFDCPIVGQFSADATPTGTGNIAWPGLLILTSLPRPLSGREKSPRDRAPSSPALSRPRYALSTTATLCRRRDGARCGTYGTAHLGPTALSGRETAPGGRPVRQAGTPGALWRLTVWRTSALG